MAFVYHQVCKTANCNHTFPFRILLFVFSENSVCFLTMNQQKLYNFTWGACGAHTRVNFDIINVHALNYICKNKDELIVLNQIKSLPIVKRQRLVELRNQAWCKIQKILSKKRN